ncbi:hypothetical protein GCM10010517_45420 [Streptosporangium fragile]|uniref:ATP-grasp domain-containing protein n=1 Tax=Streptosporangium fragile TaxID=46186 RepID=A0ABN3W262_9ACTN
MSREALPVVHAVAPDSLRSWFGHFVDLGPDDRTVHLGEDPRVDPAPLLEAIGPVPRATVVFHSGHVTLGRDQLLAFRLRELGHRAECQSRLCASLGSDKILMKEFFDRYGLVSPPWARAGDPPPGDAPDAPVVVKDRHGTQSVGTRLARAGECRLAPNELGELYVDGVEYSVLVYRDGHGTATFPPVWKGPTTPALVPPWRRLRLCPDPVLGGTWERKLRAVGKRLADLAEAHGYLEAEFLLTRTGEVHLLEINPRVSGTMRLAAMATRLPIFSLHARPEFRGHLRAVRFGGEVPYRGVPIADPDGAVFATSRLTVAGESLGEVRTRLRELGGPEALEGLDRSARTLLRAS